MNIKITAIIILILVLISSILIWYFFQMPKQKQGGPLINSFEECVEAGNPVMESYPRQCRASDGKMFVEDIGNEIEKMDLIRTDNPRPNQIVSSPLTVKGEARGSWFFEASFPIEIIDGSGNIIGQTIAQAKEEWMTSDFVPFETVLDFSAPETNKGTLILRKDNPSGLAENDDQLVIPVYFSQEQGQEKITVKVFFNSEMDQSFSCNIVFPVEREIEKTPTVGRAAIEELLKGPTAEEKEQGYFSSINSGVKLNSLVIENGIARPDFDEQIEYQLGGSCRVSAISNQIRETLKQFPTVKEVIISVNGRTEDVLQP